MLSDNKEDRKKAKEDKYQQDKKKDKIGFSLLKLFIYLLELKRKKETDVKSDSSPEISLKRTKKDNASEAPSTPPHGKLSENSNGFANTDVSSNDELVSEFLIHSDTSSTYFLLNQTSWKRVLLVLPK